MHEPVRWNLFTRIAFRLAFSYFIAFWLMRGDVYKPLLPLAARVLGFTEPFVVEQTGSGDRSVDYAKNAIALVVTLVATVLWSVIDRRRLAYPRMWDLLRVFLRYFLAQIMLSYGVSKVVPLQFPAVDPDRLVQQVGTMSPMGMLWTFMGSSPAYTCFTGVMEVTAALLLLFRRTATLGALLTACIMTNVLMLNLCYDVPVKLYGANYLLLAGILAGPDLKMLLTAAVLRRPVIPSAPWIPFRRRWMNLTAHGIKSVVVVVVLSSLCWNVVRAYRMWHAPAPKDYGVWRVEEFLRNGEAAPALLTDVNRWRRICFGMDDSLSIHAMNGLIDRMNIAKNADGVLEGGPPAWMKGGERISFTRVDPEPGVMVLRGEWRGAAVQVRLKRVLVEQFPLNMVRFRWINEYPANF